jgi:hypothetical protein
MKEIGYGNLIIPAKYNGFVRLSNDSGKATYYQGEFIPQLRFVSLRSIFKIHREAVSLGVKPFTFRDLLIFLSFYLKAYYLPDSIL